MSVPFDRISQSQRIAYCFTYLILHCAFNLTQLPVPEETPALLKTMLLAFNRGGEDCSLAFRKRPRAKYDHDSQDDESMNEEIFEEEIFERIDSNVLYALLAYLSREPEHVDTFIEVLGAKTAEFTKKCSRLLQIYITPYVDPTIKCGIRIRNKT